MTLSDNRFLRLIEVKKFIDERGFFSEIYSRERYAKLGVNNEFVQDNHSISVKAGTLRGLHFQAPPSAQAKLVRCGRGSIFDVAVDIRQGSPTFGEWAGFVLTESEGNQLYIPVGYAHGFLTLEPDSEIVYKCSDYYAPATERAILWNDPHIGVEWPLNTNPILSDKDAAAPLFANLESPFVYGVNC